MIFGLREKTAELGQFTSEKCKACKKDKKYIFKRITKFIVVFFVNLIPVSTRFECECVNCKDIVKIDKKAGRQLAKQKFSVENGNQNFAIAGKLFIAAVIVAAAIVLPIVLVGPPLSPDMLKGLVTEDGEYTIVNEDDSMVGVIKCDEGDCTLLMYNDIEDYKTADGNKFELHKHYEEIKKEDGTSYMQPIADDFGALLDKNNIKVQRYYYDIANNSYGYAVGVKDLSTIEYTDDKAVYTLSYFPSTLEELTFKIVIYTAKDWEIDVRSQIMDDGSEEIMDIMLIKNEDGKQVSETMYKLASSDGSIVYLGDLSSMSTGQEFYDFIKSSDLAIDYKNDYTYYKNTDVIMSSVFTTYDEEGNPTVSEEKYDIVQKYGYYILTAVE